MVKLLLIGGFVVFVLFVSWLQSSTLPFGGDTNDNTEMITQLPGVGLRSSLILIGDQELPVSVAETNAQRAQGLSDSTELPAGTGMLFVFPEDGKYGFWMKDMNYAIDIIWLSATGEVVHIARNAQPESYPDSFVTPTPARFVLETNANFTREHDVQVGDILTLQEEFLPSN